MSLLWVFRLRLVNVLAAMSFIFAAIVGVVSARSYWSWDEVRASSVRWNAPLLDDPMGFTYRTATLGSGWTRGELYLFFDRGLGGALSFGTYTPEQSKREHPEGIHFSWDPDGVPMPLGANSPIFPVGTWWHGFSWIRNSSPPDGYWNVILPGWPLMLLFGVLPSLRALRWFQISARTRRGDGLCKHCGYDLRATPDHCPECGSAVASSPLGQSSAR